MATRQLLRHESLLRDPCSLGVLSQNGHHLIDPFGWSLKMSIHMGLMMCAVAITPFAPPTPVRFNLPGAGGNLKTHSPASHIILNCGAIYILLAARYSLSQLHSLYTCILSRAMPMYSTEIHFVWRRQHSVSLRHDTNEK